MTLCEEPWCLLITPLVLVSGLYKSIWGQMPFQNRTQDLSIKRPMPHLLHHCQSLNGNFETKTWTSHQKFATRYCFWPIFTLVPYQTENRCYNYNVYWGDTTSYAWICILHDCSLLYNNCNKTRRQLRKIFQISCFAGTSSHIYRAV